MHNAKLVIQIESDCISLKCKMCKGTGIDSHGHTTSGDGKQRPGVTCFACDGKGFRYACIKGDVEVYITNHGDMVCEKDSTLRASAKNYGPARIAFFLKKRIIADYTYGTLRESFLQSDKNPKGLWEETCHGPVEKE